MTNTRLTDPEVLEFRFPVLLEDFHIRKNSGGRGRWKAGDGHPPPHSLPRENGLRDPVGPPPCAPFGLEGGEAGEVGENFVRRKDGTMEKLEGCDQTVLEAGEAVIIETPTAGGYGDPRKRRRIASISEASCLHHPFGPSATPNPCRSNASCALPATTCGRVRIGDEHRRSRVSVTLREIVIADGNLFQPPQSRPPDATRA